MQRLINQHAEPSGKFTTRLFSDVSIMSVACHAYAKPRIRFALNCKSSGGSIWGRFFPSLFLIKRYLLAQVIVWTKYKKISNHFDNFFMKMKMIYFLFEIWEVRGNILLSFNHKYAIFEFKWLSFIDILCYDEVNQWGCLGFDRYRSGSSCVW